MKNENDYYRMIKDCKTILITCRQFGDTGKGKFVDLFAEDADIIIRGGGGDNCGHTMCNHGDELVTHLIPSGILHDSLGKFNIIGNGVVFNPRTAVCELAELKERQISYNNLLIALNAKLITPAHIVLDGARESTSGKGKIGSTLKGIGPAYADFVDRQSLIVNDLINPDSFYKKLKKQLGYKKMILKNYDPEMIKKIMSHKSLESGDYYDPASIFDFDAIYEKYMKYGQELKYFIYDTDAFVKAALGKKKILGEGAQGDLLSISHGTYPYVTSSDCSAEGLAKGMGINISQVDLSLGIIKGFYMTRVGGGPFPTEMGGQISDDWCNGGEANRQREDELYGKASINDETNEFLQGIALRKKGNEYGATTGRPRRVGWLDLPLLRYVLQFNSLDIMFTKLDVLTDFKTIKICEKYEYQGPPVYYGGRRKIEKGDILEVAIMDSEILRYCKPIYREFPGWERDIRQSTSDDPLPLPKELLHILGFIIKKTGIRQRALSVGPDRRHTIF